MIWSGVLAVTDPVWFCACIVRVNEAGGVPVLVLVFPVNPLHEINPAARTMINNMIAPPRTMKGRFRCPRRKYANIHAEISKNAAIYHHNMTLCNGTGHVGNLRTAPTDGLKVTLTVKLVVAFPFAGTMT